MNQKEFKDKTKKFAVDVIRFVENLPRSSSSGVIGKQLLRSATSTGANYRAACRARSNADFIAKLGIVEEESDESMYWLELLVTSGAVQQESIANLYKEGGEIVALVVSSINTARGYTR